MTRAQPKDLSCWEVEHLILQQQCNNNVTTYLGGWSVTRGGNPQVGVVVYETKILAQNQYIESLKSANRIKLLWFRHPRALVSDSVNIPNPPHSPLLTTLPSHALLSHCRRLSLLFCRSCFVLLTDSCLILLTCFLQNVFIFSYIYFNLSVLCKIGCIWPQPFLNIMLMLTEDRTEKLCSTLNIRTKNLITNFFYSYN